MIDKYPSKVYVAQTGYHIIGIYADCDEAVEACQARIGFPAQTTVKQIAPGCYILHNNFSAACVTPEELL